MSLNDAMMAARRGEGPLRHARATWRRLLGDRVLVGYRSTFSVTIGDGSVVAAGSIVTRDVPTRTLVAGIPAVVVRELTD